MDQDNLEKIIIIDYGSQVTQLIARKVREIGVYSEIINFNKAKKINQNKFIKGIIINLIQIYLLIFDKYYLSHPPIH